MIDMLMNSLGGFQPARSHDVVHASDATKPDFCPRHWALLDLLNLEPKGMYVSTALQITFDVGRATADLLANKWAGNRVVGNWECTSCGGQRTFTTKPGQGCTHGWQRCNWQYREVNFTHQDSGMSGSIDLLLDLGAPKLFVIEVKIIAVDEFETLKMPLAEHRIRTNLYMKLIDESNSPYAQRIDTMQARVLYISRGFGKKVPIVASKAQVLPLKEYEVIRSDGGLSAIVGKAKQVKVFRETGKMPSGICFTALDPIAKKCSTCAQCFSGKYPADQPQLSK